ncbi:MAG: HNH endonuclease [Pseudomonadota bacterium]
MAKFNEYYAGARIDETLFAAMVDPVQRERLRKVLVETYFDPTVQAAVAEQGAVNLAAYEYAAALTQGVHETVEPAPGLATEASRKVRDQGFRKAIVTLYDHRCALCGIRMLTADGHTIVEAAHIVPWSKSQDDHPTNGLCLCRLCHWSFDAGLMGVGKKYEVLVSRRTRTNENIPGHVLTLQDRPIFKPDKESFWPAQTNLATHRQDIFTR